jgi:hypothetical protein
VGVKAGGSTERARHLNWSWGEIERRFMERGHELYPSEPHLGHLCLDQIRHFEAIAGFGHHFHSRQCFQQRANARAHQRVVIGEYETNRFRLQVFNARFDAFEEFPNLGFRPDQLPASGVPGGCIGQQAAIPSLGNNIKKSVASGCQNWLFYPH